MAARLPRLGSHPSRVLAGKSNREGGGTVAALGMYANPHEQCGRASIKYEEQNSPSTCRYFSHLLFFLSLIPFSDLFFLNNTVETGVVRIATMLGKEIASYDLQYVIIGRLFSLTWSFKLILRFRLSRACIYLPIRQQNESWECLTGQFCLSLARAAHFKGIKVQLVGKMKTCVPTIHRT